MSRFVISGGKVSEEGHGKPWFHLFRQGASTGWGVAQRGSGANMSVDVAVGGGLIATPAAVAYYGWTDAVENVAVSTSNPSNPRIDTLVAYIDLSLITSSTTNNLNALNFKVVAGTPTTGATLTNLTGAPTSTAIQTAIGTGNPYIAGPHILVGATATQIITANVGGAFLPMAHQMNFLWDAANSRFVDLLGVSPAGVVNPYAGNSAPSGWLICDGTAVSRTTFAALFTAIGILHGSGNGSTTFNVPDLRGRSVVGVDSSSSQANRSQMSTTISTTSASTAATVGSAAGLAEGMVVVSANITAGTTIVSISGTSVTLSANANATASGTAARFSPLSDAQTVGATGGELVHTLDINEMPSHTHPISYLGTAGPGGGGATLSGPNSLSTASTGGSVPHNNLHPSMALNYIIKT